MAESEFATLPVARVEQIHSDEVRILSSHVVRGVADFLLCGEHLVSMRSEIPRNSVHFGRFRICGVVNFEVVVLLVEVPQLTLLCTIVRLIAQAMEGSGRLRHSRQFHVGEGEFLIPVLSCTVDDSGSRCGGKWLILAADITSIHDRIFSVP